MSRISFVTAKQEFDELYNNKSEFEIFIPEHLTQVKTVKLKKKMVQRMNSSINGNSYMQL